MLFKLSKTQNLTEARAAAAWMAEYVGFCFDKSQPEYISPLQAKEIAAWLSGTLPVAELPAGSADEAAELLNMIGFGVAQTADSALAAELESRGFAVIREISPNSLRPDDLSSICYTTDPKTATELIKAGYTRVILETEPSAENADLLRNLKPFGFAFTGNSETETGMRDLSHWSDWMDTILDETP